MFLYRFAILFTGRGILSLEGGGLSGVGWGVCVEGQTPPRYGQPVVGTYPTGMHSCYVCFLI